jgi:hypothetical protein
MARSAPKIVGTRTEERDGQTFTVTTLEDGRRKTPPRTWGPRQRPRKQRRKPRRRGVRRA